jgi:hypothetical protein
MYYNQIMYESESLPSTYVHDTGLALAMAYAENNVYDEALRLTKEDKWLDAIILQGEQRKIGVIAGRAYIAALEESPLEDGEYAKIEWLRKQL